MGSTQISAGSWGAGWRRSGEGEGERMDGCRWTSKQASEPTSILIHPRLCTLSRPPSSSAPLQLSSSSCWPRPVISSSSSSSFPSLSLLPLYTPASSPSPSLSLTPTHPPTLQTARGRRVCVREQEEEQEQEQREESTHTPSTRETCVSSHRKAVSPSPSTVAPTARPHPTLLEDTPWTRPSPLTNNPHQPNPPTDEATRVGLLTTDSTAYTRTPPYTRTPTHPPPPHHER